MTYGHLLLAAGMSIYMLVAISHEERDLVGYFGEDYEQYRQKVCMLLPGWEGGANSVTRPSTFAA